jgi:hypothetical protein
MKGIVRANDVQTRRHSRWNNTTMRGAYLTSLSREMMRSMTGFPTNGRSFCLAHAALDPPTSLCKKLFPTINEWHGRLAAKNSLLTTTILLAYCRCQWICTIGHDVQEDFYTRLGAHAYAS